MKRKKYKHRDTNNSVDDEFGSNYMSEEEFNKKHMKALEQADPHNFKKKRKKKPKEKFNHFKGLGGGSSSRGPWKK